MTEAPARSGSWEYRTTVTRPKLIDGVWSWRLERRLVMEPGELAPLGTETRYGDWSTLMSKPGARTAGSEDTEFEARDAARAAKERWVAQNEHERKPAATVFPL